MSNNGAGLYMGDIYEKRVSIKVLAVFVTLFKVRSQTLPIYEDVK